MQKTQLVQENIGDPLEAPRVFNQEHTARIPLVLVPSERWWCSCYYTIPTGVYSIVHSCGDDAFPQGLADPGLQLCKPYWNQVAYMVTQQSCTYNAPVKSCPTKDNVMVDCELTLVFSIGPGPSDVKNFVYYLGALKFNEFLSAETEEAIRQLVRATPLEEVYELRGSSSQHVANVLHILNQKFGKFGVTFSKAAITDVVLSDELRRILQGTTEFKTKIRELDKEHDHHMRLIEYDYQQKHSEMERDFERKLQDLDADVNVALVHREKDVVNAESNREVAITKANEIAAVEKQRAEAELKVVTIRAEQEKKELLGKITAEAESKKINVDQETQVQINESEKQILISQYKGDALKVEAKAEGDAAESLRTIREHNLQMAKLEVIEGIATNSNIVISGDNGERLLNSILDKDLLSQIVLKN